MNTGNSNQTNQNNNNYTHSQSNSTTTSTSPPQLLEGSLAQNPQQRTSMNTALPHVLANAPAMPPPHFPVSLTNASAGASSQQQSQQTMDPQLSLPSSNANTISPIPLPSDIHNPSQAALQQQQQQAHHMTGTLSQLQNPPLPLNMSPPQMIALSLAQELQPVLNHLHAQNASISEYISNVVNIVERGVNEALVDVYTRIAILEHRANVLYPASVNYNAKIANHTQYAQIPLPGDWRVLSYELDAKGNPIGILLDANSRPDWLRQPNLGYRNPAIDPNTKAKHPNRVIFLKVLKKLFTNRAIPEITDDRDEPVLYVGVDLRHHHPTRIEAAIAYLQAQTTDDMNDPQPMFAFLDRHFCVEQFTQYKGNHSRAVRRFRQDDGTPLFEKLAANRKRKSSSLGGAMLDLESGDENSLMQTPRGSARKRSLKTLSGLSNLSEPASPK